MQDNIHLYGLNHKTADVSPRGLRPFGRRGLGTRPGLPGRPHPRGPGPVHLQPGGDPGLGGPGTDPGPLVLSRWAGHCNRDAGRLAPHV
jgi:hypothetical protein